MKRALAHRAAETYVLASTEKIGAASRFTVLPLAEVSGLITDADPRQPLLRELERAGVLLIHASGAAAGGDRHPPQESSL
jgi:DeoR/GlpR family transcriptional regulator of sugar metabolism